MIEWYYRYILSTDNFTKVLSTAKQKSKWNKLTVMFISTLKIISEEECPSITSIIRLD